MAVWTLRALWTMEMETEDRRRATMHTHQTYLFRPFVRCINNVGKDERYVPDL